MGRSQRSNDRIAEKKIVETLQETKSQTKTSRLLRIGFNQVHRVMHQAVDLGLSRRSPEDRYYYLSIDEKAVHRGHDYISILSDEQTGVVIEVIEGRSDDDVEELCLTSLTETQRNEVKSICTDMWQPYIKAAKSYFPKALHCHDHFHTVGYLNRAVDKCRRREVKHHEALKHSKYLFLKDQMNLTDEQHFKFEAIRKANYEVSRAWQVKENFRDIAVRQTPERAATIYRMWRKNALDDKIKEINEVVQTFDRHEKGIINAMTTGANNARAERLNGSIQELKTIGRGYRNTQNFRIAILFFHGDLDMSPHKKE